MIISSTKCNWLFGLKLLLISLIATSCISKKKINYFQANQTGKDLQSLDIDHKYIAKLQPGDILSILVSSLSPEASEMFNPYQLNLNSIASQQQTIQTTSPTPATGYLVNQEGFITLPMIGKVNVLGLTTEAATDLIVTKLNKYLEQPTVNIRILNFKISVLGEVNRPAVYTIPNEEVTLPEALAMAGDLTIYGKRNNVMLIRNVNGKREFNRIDLTKRDLFNSPYYYLQANDVLYVEPTKSKITSTDRTVQLAPIVLSALSVLTVLFVNYHK
jgi:polysaccharide export outer membrane protein